MEIKFTTEFENAWDSELAKILNESLPLDGEYEISIPAKYEVCDNCQGTGTQVNPNVDGNGLTPDDFAEDPEFAEDYMDGKYDVQCLKCNGLRVVLVPNEKDANTTLLKLYHENLKGEQEEAASERYWNRFSSDR